MCVLLAVYSLRRRRRRRRRRRGLVMLAARELARIMSAYRRAESRARALLQALNSLADAPRERASPIGPDACGQGDDDGGILRRRLSALLGFFFSSGVPPLGLRRLENPMRRWTIPGGVAWRLVLRVDPVGDDLDRWLGDCMWFFVYFKNNKIDTK